MAQHQNSEPPAELHCEEPADWLISTLVVTVLLGLTFARYFIHDPVHHLHDVRKGFEALAS